MLKTNTILKDGIPRGAPIEVIDTYEANKGKLIITTHVGFYRTKKITEILPFKWARIATDNSRGYHYLNLSEDDLKVLLEVLTKELKIK